jgi:hypothetical protein
VNVHQPGWNSSGGAARSGFIRSETVHSASAVRTPSVVQPTALPFANSRHHSGNPAVVGGPASSDNKNAGTINGTRMNRKP